jgi:hypothetical protein
MSKGRRSKRSPRFWRRGMAAHGTTPAEFAAILDEQRAKWAAIAHDHSIKPVH